MPIFVKQLQLSGKENQQDAIKKMVNHIKYIQEQLEYTLLNLDSDNVIEIDTNKTTISGSTGGTSLGSYIQLTGKNGESFSVGKNSSGNFEFSLKGPDGTQMYMNSSGKLVILEDLTIDGGEW